MVLIGPNQFVRHESTYSSQQLTYLITRGVAIPSLHRDFKHFREMSACSVFFIENIPGSPNDVETLDSAERPIEQLKNFQNTGDGLNLSRFLFAWLLRTDKQTDKILCI